MWEIEFLDLINFSDRISFASLLPHLLKSSRFQVIQFQIADAVLQSMDSPSIAVGRSNAFRELKAAEDINSAVNTCKLYKMFKTIK